MPNIPDRERGNVPDQETIPAVQEYMQAIDAVLTKHGVDPQHTRRGGSFVVELAPSDSTKPMVLPLGFSEFFGRVFRKKDMGVTQMHLNYNNIYMEVHDFIYDPRIVKTRQYLNIHIPTTFTDEDLRKYLKELIPTWPDENLSPKPYDDPITWERASSKKITGRGTVEPRFLTAFAQIFPEYSLYNKPRHEWTSEDYALWTSHTHKIILR